MSEPHDLKELIRSIDGHVPDAKKGLPQDVFFFVSRLTPLVSVDLLVKNDKNQTLLTWRHDEFYLGWHVPGGIVRFKERFESRIAAVAKGEFGATVRFDSTPIAINEKFASDRDVRGHFISLLFSCSLTSEPTGSMRCLDPQYPEPNQWMWHDQGPENLLSPHGVYRKFIGS